MLIKQGKVDFLKINVPVYCYCQISDTEYQWLTIQLNIDW